MLLDEDDDLWVELRHMHIADVSKCVGHSVSPVASPPPPPTVGHVHGLSPRVSAPPCKPRPSANSSVWPCPWPSPGPHVSPGSGVPAVWHPTSPAHTAVKLQPWRQSPTHPCSLFTLFTTRRVTELLKTFCESKRLTTDKVGAGPRLDGQLGQRGLCRHRVGAGPQSRGRARSGIRVRRARPHGLPVPRPTSKTCPTS